MRHQERSRTGGFIPEQGSEKGWHTAKQAEEQNARHLRETQASLAQTAWDESGSLGGTFSGYEKDLRGACGKGGSVLHSWSCGNPGQLVGQLS